MAVGSGHSAVSSLDHEAHKSKKIQTLLFLFVVFCSSFLSAGFLMLPLPAVIQRTICF